MSFKALKELTIKRDLGHMQIMDTRFKNYQEEYTLQYGITKKDLKQIMQNLQVYNNEIQAIMPRIEFTGLISKGEKTLSFGGKGIDPLAEVPFASTFIKIIEGKNLGLDFEKPYKYEVIIGRELALALKAKVGDELTIMSTTIDGAINAIDLELSGIFTSGVNQRDLRSIIVPIKVAGEILRTDKITKLVLGLYHTKDLEKINKNLKIKSPLKIYTWEELADFYQAVVKLYTIFFTFLGILIYLVVIATVFGSIYSLVLEKVKEFGILKANGFSDMKVLSLILLEIFFLSLFCAFASFIISNILIFIINYAEINMPPPPGGVESYPLMLNSDIKNIIYISLSLPIICVLASIKPALKAKKLKISDALRM